MVEKLRAAGLRPESAHRSPGWWGRGLLPPTQEPHVRSRPSASITGPSGLSQQLTVFISRMLRGLDKTLGVVDMYSLSQAFVRGNC